MVSRACAAADWPTSVNRNATNVNRCHQQLAVTYSDRHSLSLGNTPTAGRLAGALTYLWVISRHTCEHVTS